MQNYYYNFIMSLNSNAIYSSSLKRMIGFKLFPQINPEAIKVTTNLEGPNEQQMINNLIKQRKTDKQISKIRRQIIEAREKQRSFQKQIDNIVNKMVDEGLADVSEKKIGKSGSTNRLRIVSQRSQQKIQRKKDKLPTKLPQIQKSASYHKLLPGKKMPNLRLKTETYIKNNEENEVYEPINAQKYIKHYRAGMTSLKKLKIKPLYEQH